MGFKPTGKTINIVGDLEIDEETKMKISISISTIARHVTSEKAREQILSTCKFTASKSGWLGPGLYAHTGNGIEGKGDAVVCFDYRDLRLCDSGKPKELGQAQWDKLRQKDVRTINNALSKLGYDGYAADHNGWILVFPQSINKVKPL